MLKRNKIIYALTLVLIPIALAEVMLRTFSEPSFASNIVFDPLLGHRGPKSTFSIVGNTRVYYNQFGYRDKPYEPTEESRQDKVRIVTLGDSITEAVAITDPASIWPQWLEDVLNSALIKPSSTYRFAASDWGTYQELLALDRDGKELEPDIVVLQFLGINDFTNNSFTFAEKTVSENDNWRPYIDLKNPNKIMRVNNLKHFFRTWSYIYRYIDSIHVSNHLFGLQGIVNRGRNCDLYLNLFKTDPIDNAWKDAFKSTEAIAKEFGKRKSKYKKIVAVYFPSSVEIIDYDWNKTIEEPLKNCSPGAKINRMLPELVFENAFRSAGIDTISLRQRFLEEKNKRDLYDSSGHLTPRGHQLAGEQIAYYLYNNYSTLFNGKK